LPRRCGDGRPAYLSFGDDAFGRVCFGGGFGGVGFGRVWREQLLVLLFLIACAAVLAFTAPIAGRFPGGLAVPIGVHAAWNLGHWALGLKGSPGVWRVVVDEQHPRGAGFASILIYDAVMLSAALAFWLWHRRFAKRTTDFAPS